MKNIIFVTGTNTDVGKTYFICNLLKEIYKLKPSLRGKVIGYKLIETGVKDIPKDAYKISKVNGFYLPPLYTFQHPLSPFDASYLEKRKIKKVAILKKLAEISKKYDFVFVEGAGGIEVPILPFYTYLDLIHELNLKTILVSLNKLGTINDTLLSAKAIGKNLSCIYFNFLPNKNDLSKKLNIRTINLFLRKKYNMTVYFSDNIKSIANYILEKFILKSLRKKGG